MLDVNGSRAGCGELLLGAAQVAQHTGNADDDDKKRRGAREKDQVDLQHDYALPPKVFESLRRELGVPHRLLNILAPEIGLQSPGIEAFCWPGQSRWRV